MRFGKDRLESFSDGIFAILITILVLEIHAPKSAQFSALQPLASVFLSYALSFVYLAIYWNNHHHMLHTVEKVNGSILWANLHLLFWLSLVPFSTGWMGENHFANSPTALYGVNLLMAAIAYWILQRRIIVSQGPQSLLMKAVGADLKGKTSPLLYAVAIAIAPWWRLVAVSIYIVVALIWLVPDKRIERAMSKS